MIKRSIGFISLLLVKVVRFVASMDRVRGRVVAVVFMSGHRTGQYREVLAARQLRVPSQIGLARPATWPLAGDHDTVVEDLPTPGTPVLGAVECTGKALLPDR